MIGATLSASEQDRIGEEGAAYCRSHRINKDWWLSNPYPTGTDQHELWQAGFEAEAECVGSEGCDW